MGIGGAVGALDLLVRIVGDTSGLDKAIDGSTGKVGAFGKSFDVGGIAKLGAFAGVAGIAAVAIGEMTMAAAADRDEQLKLEAAVTAAGAATATSTDQINEAIAAGQAKAFSDSETRDALQSLVTATGDVTSANALLTQSQDIARLAGVDLATAADAVAKAQAGQDTALARMLPGMEKGATASETLANASALAAGQADIYAKSAAGMQAKAGDAFGELTEAIGGAFLPILDELLPVILEIVGVLTKLIQAVLPILTQAIKILMAVLRPILGIIVQLVEWIAKMVSVLLDAVGAAGRFLDSINPLKDIKLPSLPFLNSAAMPTAVAMAGGVGRAGSESFAVASGRGGVTFNFYTTGDSIEQEAAVVRALRRVQRLNAGRVLPAAGRTA